MGLQQLALVFTLCVAAPDPQPGLPTSFRATPSPAGQAKLLEIDARPLADARALLGRGRPAEALKRLVDLREGPLGDHAALVSADALLALSQPEAALASYARAVEQAQTSAVRLAAARGVIETLSLLDRAEDRLAWIEGLRGVEPSSTDLRLAHAETLLALGRTAAADELLKALLIDVPSSPMASAAATLRSRVPAKERSPFTLSELRARFRHELEADATAAAGETLAMMGDLPPREEKLLQWDLLRASGARAQEVELIDALLAEDPEGPRSDELYLRKGRIALSADQADAAVSAFDQVVARFERSKEAVEAAFLAAWTRYDEGDFADAEARMRAFIDRFPGSDRVTEAWWYVGWSAYLDGRHDDAIAAFGDFLKQHPRSDLVPFAHYWTGRALAKTDRKEQAIEAYRRASSSSPLSYYGFWARTRLRELGVPAERPAPPGPIRAFDLRQILVDLGPRRPISVDRAIAFHAAGLERDVDDEVRTLLRALPEPDSVRQVVLRVDLLHGLDAYGRAFRYAYRHVPPSGGVMGSDYWAWRAYQHVYPEAYPATVRSAAGEHGVSPFVVWSIMRSESHYREDALSPVGARGLMQLMPATARRIGRTVAGARSHSARFVEPESNVWLGAWYLAQLDERYRGYWPAKVAAYNAGPTATDRWMKELAGLPTDEFVERISYRETRRYVRRVLETLWTYELLYGEPMTALRPTADPAAPPVDAVEF